MRKNYRHYIKEVTNEVNKKQPQIAHVTQSEVAKVLKYLNKNVITVMGKRSNRVQISHGFVLWNMYRNRFKDEARK